MYQGPWDGEPSTRGSRCKERKAGHVGRDYGLRRPRPLLSCLPLTMLTPLCLTPWVSQVSISSLTPHFLLVTRAGPQASCQ